MQTNFGEIEAEYLCTTKNKDQYFYVREFRDMVGNEFWVNDTGIITLYFWFKSEKNLTNEIDEYKAIEIANNFIEKYDYLDFNDYIIKVDYKDWQEKFIVTYQKFINEVATADCAEVTVDLYGNIYCFSSQFLGMIPKDLELDFDFERINNSIISRLDDIFSREKKNFDEVNYDLSNFELIMLDYNKYALVYNVKIDCVEIDKTNEDLKYHEGSLITFLVK